FTSAPGMTAPLESVTVPVSDEKKLPCAWAVADARAMRKMATHTLRATRDLIQSPFVVPKGFQTRSCKLLGDRMDVNSQKRLARVRKPLRIQKLGRGLSLLTQSPVRRLRVLEN